MFKAAKQGRDKTVQSKLQARLYFKVRHISPEEDTESMFQEKPAILNRHSCYFLEENMSYRDIIGGFELEKVGVKGRVDDYHQLTSRVGGVKKVVMADEHFKGYCFNVDLVDQLWTLCHLLKRPLEHFRNQLKVQAIMNYLTKNHISNPSFFH